jgi:hypothetical protein
MVGQIPVSLGGRLSVVSFTVTEAVTLRCGNFSDTLVLRVHQ